MLWCTCKCYLGNVIFTAGMRTFVDINTAISSYVRLTDQQQYASSEQSKLPDPNRIRSRVPANMPKLFIPSTVTKFPPEITVTPPTPTLLSPKGSISEETKQRLKVSSLPPIMVACPSGTKLWTPPPAVLSARTECHLVVPVRRHSEKGHADPAGAGGAGNIQPGVVSGERVGRGGRLHGHLSWNWLVFGVFSFFSFFSFSFIPEQLSVLML